MRADEDVSNVEVAFDCLVILMFIVLLYNLLRWFGL